MYKSTISLLFHRASLALILLAAACSGGSDRGSYHEEALESGQRTQHLEDDDITGNDYRNSGYTEAPTYSQEDTAIAKRRIEPLDSMSVNNKNKNGQPWQ